jgi:hypothetical protein
MIACRSGDDVCNILMRFVICSSQNRGKCDLRTSDLIWVVLHACRLCSMHMTLQIYSFRKGFEAVLNSVKLETKNHAASGSRSQESVHAFLWWHTTPMHTVHSHGVARTALQCASNNYIQQAKACNGKAKKKKKNQIGDHALPQRGFGLNSHAHACPQARSTTQHSTCGHTHKRKGTKQLPYQTQMFRTV